MRDLSLDALYDMPASDGQLPIVRAWLSKHWRDFVVTPDALHDSPGDHGCGLYFLWDADDSLLYVGQSRELRTRVRNHLRFGTKHALATFLPLPPPLLDCIEYAYIYALTPPQNKKFADVGWAPMSDMSAVIDAAWGEFTG